MLRDNQIDNVAWDNKKFKRVKTFLYDKLGFQLVKVNNSYKLQVPPKDLISITKDDSPLTYKIFLLIVAYMITKEVGETFERKDLYDEIESELGSLSVNEKETLFKNVVMYMVREGYMRETTEVLEEGFEIKLLTKLKETYTMSVGERYPLSRLAQITNHLFLNGFMDKTYYKDLWNGLTNEDLLEYFEQFHNEEGSKGYDIICDGDFIRLIDLDNLKGFPNMNKAEHRILVDILDTIKVIDLDTEEWLALFTNSVKQSSHYKESISLDSLQKLVQEYELNRLNVKLEKNEEVTESDS